MTLAKQNYKGPFCCLDMDLMLQNSDPFYSVKYNPAIRQYYLKSLEGPYIRALSLVRNPINEMLKG
jgi:hypothetical protein